MQLKKETLRCLCHSKEHEIEFAFDDELFYCLIHLSPLPFWKRVKHAFKYVFGYRCTYGDFEEMIFDQPQLKQLDALIHEFSYDKKHLIDGPKSKIISKEQEVDLV